MSPVFYIRGGSQQTALPYGGFHNISVIGGSTTYPAVVYYDDTIDNQSSFDDLACSGVSTNTKHCDGLSTINFLNMSLQKFRNDGIGGYGIRIRYSQAISSQGKTANQSINKYTWTAYDTVGKITFTVAGSEVPNGTAVLLFTTGVLPTRTSTGLALNGALSGICYYVGNCNETNCTLHDTEAAALAGTGQIVLTAATGSGTHQFCMFPTSYQVTTVDTTANTLT